MGATVWTREIEGALGALPIFPLPQVVLFPGALVPLHVFEPRYRAMLKDCLASDRALALALLGPPVMPAGGEGADGPPGGLPPIAAVAGVGAIVEHEPLPDGRSNILVQGRARVRLEELRFVPPYRRARATFLEDVEDAVPHSELAALSACAQAFVAEVRKHDPRFSLRLPPDLPAGALSDFCAHHFIVDTSLRQRLLEELCPGARMRLVTHELATQHSALLRESGGLLH